MKRFVLILLVVLGVSVGARFLYRSVADEVAWRTNQAVRLSVLRQAEQHRIQAKIFQGFPAQEEGDKLATIIIADINQAAETEVIDAKKMLLWLYEDKDHRLSAEEVAQAAQWQKDVAA